MPPIHRYRLAGVFLLALSSSTAPSLFSQSFPTPPGQHDFILDEASLIQSQGAQQIKNLCEGLLKEESIPIVVVTIPSLAKYDASDIESYARALFDKWGIGSQTNDYGILLLVIIGGFMLGVATTSRVAWLKRLLATHREMRREVERGAEEAFARFRVAGALRGTGILLYVSLFERIVCVLGDAPIGAKLDQEIWNKIHGTITDGIRRKRPADAFCQAIAHCGELLSQHFPRRAGDIDKLGNELRIID